MQNQSNYWTAWMAGWVAATKTILAAQQRALDMLVPPNAPIPPVSSRAAASVLETAADKPAPRRRGRPPKQHTGAEQHTPRKRGRRPKTRAGA